MRYSVDFTFNEATAMHRELSLLLSGEIVSFWESISQDRVWISICYAIASKWKLPNPEDKKEKYNKKFKYHEMFALREFIYLLQERYLYNHRPYVELSLVEWKVDSLLDSKIAAS